jgi:primosomal protein N'
VLGTRLAVFAPQPRPGQYVLDVDDDPT